MKSPAEISAIHDKFQEKFGFNVKHVQQGSAEWFKVKLGVISASNAHKAVAKKDSETRATYMAELVAQVCTGQMEEINSKYLDWGNQHEDAARSAYEFMKGTSIEVIPFAFKDDTFRVGCSPDGIIKDIDGDRGVEIKCPYNASHYVKFAVDQKIKPEYVWQYQFSLWVLGADRWDFVQYHPLMRVNPISVLTVERDPEKMIIFDDLIPAFIEDMDKMLSKLGTEFGGQWQC